MIFPSRLAVGDTSPSLRLVTAFAANERYGAELRLVDTHGNVVATGRAVKRSKNIVLYEVGLSVNEEDASRLAIRVVNVEVSGLVPMQTWDCVGTLEFVDVPL